MADFQHTTYTTKVGATVTVPADLWKTVTEAVSRSGIGSDEDVEKMIGCIREALIVGLGSAGEIFRVRANIDSAREWREGFTLDSDFVPKYVACEAGEAMFEFHSALAYLDILRIGALLIAAADRAIYKANR
jgi:hypothetical protein